MDFSEQGSESSEASGGVQTDNSTKQPNNLIDEVIEFLRTNTRYHFEERDGKLVATINADAARGLAGALEKHCGVTVELQEDIAGNRSLPQRDRKATLSLNADEKTLRALQNTPNDKKCEIGAMIRNEITLATSERGRMAAR